MPDETNSGSVHAGAIAERTETPPATTTTEPAKTTEPAVPEGMMLVPVEEYKKVTEEKNAITSQFQEVLGYAQNLENYITTAVGTPQTDVNGRAQETTLPPGNPGAQERDSILTEKAAEAKFKKVLIEHEQEKAEGQRKAEWWNNFYKMKESELSSKFEFTAAPEKVMPRIHYYALQLYYKGVPLDKAYDEAIVGYVKGEKGKSVLPKTEATTEKLPPASGGAEVSSGVTVTPSGTSPIDRQKESVRKLEEEARRTGSKFVFNEYVKQNQALKQMQMLDKAKK